MWKVGARNRKRRREKEKRTRLRVGACCGGPKGSLSRLRALLCCWELSLWPVGNASDCLAAGGQVDDIQQRLGMRS